MTPPRASEQTAEAKAIAEGLLPATTVTEALRRVMRDLPAIGKDQQASEQQGGYAYRGIEQITKEAQRLFAEHGVIYVPRVLSHETRDLVVNSKPWTDTVLLVEYDVIGPGGPEDRITVGPLLAIGRDNSDKGANKALTQAFKYALIQTLCISDAKDDADGQTHEADAGSRSTASAPPQEAALRARDAVAVRIKALPAEQREEVRQFLIDSTIPLVPAEWTDRQMNAVVEQVAAREAAATHATGAQDGPGEAGTAEGAPEAHGGQEGAQEGPAGGAGDGDPVCTSDGCPDPVVIFDDQGNPWCATHQPL